MSWIRNVKQAQGIATQHYETGILIPILLVESRNGEEVIGKDRRHQLLRNSIRALVQRAGNTLKSNIFFMINESTICLNRQQIVTKPKEAFWYSCTNSIQFQNQFYFIKNTNWNWSPYLQTWRKVCFQIFWKQTYKDYYL